MMFNKVVEAMEASAMTTFICSFSASRLKGFRFDGAALDLSFLSLELPNRDPVLDEEEA
jgi:hypothetical protein